MGADAVFGLEIVISETARALGWMEGPTDSWRTISVEQVGCLIMIYAVIVTEIDEFASRVQYLFFKIFLR